jgi:hypothetical protein
VIAERKTQSEAEDYQELEVVNEKPVCSMSVKSQKE